EWDKLISLYKRFLRKYSRDTHLDPDVEYQLSLKIAEIYEDHFNDIYRATRAYAQILESHPEREEIAERLDVMRERESQIVAEVEELKKRLGQTSLVSEVVALNTKIGTILYTHGDLEQASKFFQENRTLDRTHVDSLHLLQAIYERMNKWRELKDVCEAELAQPIDAERRLHLLKKLGEINEKYLGDIQETFEKYEEALTLDPNDVEIIKALQQIYSDLHRWQKYVEFLRREAALTEEPSALIPLLFEIGVTLHEKLGRTDDAVRSLNQLLTYDRKHLRGLNVLEKIFRKAQRWKELTDILATKAQLITDPVARSKIYQSLGEFFEEKLSNPRLALENYIVSFLCNKANTAAFKALERLYQEQQNWEDILGIYETAIEESEKGGHGDYNLEELYVKKGQVELFHLGFFQESIESFRKGLAINPLNDTCFGSLKTIFLQHQEWEKLFDLYEQRAFHEATDARKIALYYEMAELCENRLRSKNLAIEYYQRILEHDRFQENAFLALEKHYQALQRWEELVRLYQLRLTVARNGEDVLQYNQKISAIYEKRLREFEKAIYYARKMLNVAPANNQALRILSRLYELNKMWDELIEISLREVKITTDTKERAYIYFRIGSLIETQIRDDEEAIKYYREAVKCDEKCFPALHGIREIFYRKGQWERVIHYLQQENALWEGAKEKSSILYRIGEIYLEQLAERDLAIEAFEKAIKVHPENAVALQALLNLYFDDQRWDKAVEVARALTENAADQLTETQKAEAFFKRGTIARKLNFLFEAADSFKISLEFNPAHPDALASMAELYVSKNVDTAFNEIFFRLEKTFIEQQSTNELARLYRYKGKAAESDYQLEDALEYYRAALKIEPQGMEFLESLVEFFTKLRDFDAAIQAISAFVQQTTNRESQIRCYSMLAHIYGDFLERHSDAVSAYRELLRLNPQDTDALFRIAQHLYVKGEFDEALITINQVIERAKTSASERQQSLYYFYLGRIMEAVFGDETVSLEYYLQARDLDRKNVQAVVAAARIYQKSKDWKNFEKLFRVTVPVMGRKLPQEVQIPLRLFFAEGFINKGDFSIAAEEYEAILAMDAGHIETNLALSALALEHLGNVELALKHLSAVAHRDVTQIKAFHKIGRTYKMQSFFDKAFCTFKLLEFYQSARRDELEFIRENQSRIIERRLNPLKAITPEIFDSFIHKDDEKSNMFKEIWESLEEYLVHNFLLPSMDAPLPKREATSPRNHPVLKKLVEHVHQLLNVEEADIFIRPGARTDICLEKNIKWGIILSEKFLTEKYTTNEQIFLLGRMYATQLEAHNILLKLSRDELDGLYQLMVDIVQTYLEDKAGFAVKFVRIPKRMVTKLEAIVEKYDIKEIDKLKLPDFHRIADNADQTRTRVGHIISGDIAASLGALMKL
ncbi:MAG: tetratricopeptide repeat protein, partial [Myxococcales bacterium]|nr:tetratricopeptide repeat protein [Myxococcales bacterium]